jgi:hypothetical protein
LRFARLSPSLDLTSAVKLDDPAFAAAANGFNAGVTVLAAPLPSGWVVAGYAEPDIFVHAVDATGGSVSRISLTNIPVAGTTFAPILARRSGGGPLVIWTRFGVAQASVISADGRSATTPITLPVDTSAITGEMTAAFVGDAFYVAMAVYDDVTNAVSAHLHLIRVAPDGTSATAVDGLRGSEVWSPYIVEDADGLQIVYAGVLPCVAGYSMLIQSVDRSGASLSPARLFADPSTGWLWRPSAIAFGRDIVTVLLGGDSELLTVTRSPTDGSAAPVQHTVGRGPAHTFYLGDIARRGTDAIVAWMDYTRSEVQLARVAP